MNVGKRIREIRQNKGLLQADVERRSGLLKSYVSRVESGATVPSLSTLERFAKALGVQPYELLFEERNSTRKRGRTVITTPFPSISRVARVLGMSKQRADRIVRLVGSDHKGNRKLQRAG